MMPYIINAGLILAGCLAFYKIFLRKETFYRLNRSVLLLCLAIAFSLPLIPVPQEWSFRKSSSKMDVESVIQYAQQQGRTVHDPTLQEITPASKEVSSKPNTLISQTEATSPLSRQAAISNTEPGISFSQVLKAVVWLYWFGVIVFALNFLVQLALLLIRAYSYPVIRDGKFRIVELSGDQAPCSFLNNIFINPAKYDWSTYNQILAHEKVHVSERHSLDILLAEIVLIFQWFNPFAWVYRKEMENNLEFLTDETVLQKENVEICSYQMSLLKVSAAHLPLSLTTNYNQSLLKKRIAMMNAKKSSLNTSWKYFFLLPMLVLFACLLNEPIVKAQTKSPTNSKNANSNKNTSTNKNTNNNTKKSNTNQNRNVNHTENVDSVVDLIVDRQVAKTDLYVDVTVSQNVNSNIMMNKNDHRDADRPVQGYWFATIKGDKIQFEFSKSPIKDKHSYNETGFSLSEFPSLPRAADAEFKLTREAGTMIFNGRFEGNEGKGSYKFVADKSYQDFMNQNNKEKLDDDEAMIFFFLDIKKSYVQMLNEAGYKKLDNEHLISFAALNVDKSFINSLSENGFNHVEPDELVGARALNVDGDYIKEIHEAGYKDISLEQLVSFKSLGIDKAYLQSISKLKKGNEQLDAEDVVSLKALGIDDRFPEEFKQVGYNDVSHEDLISMKSVGVTPEYIKTFQSVGYSKIPLENYVAMKSLNVTPEFLKSFQAIGYKEIEAEDLVSLKSLNVTPEYIKGFNGIGYKNIPLEQVVSLKATGVTPSYVKNMKAKGFNYSSLEKYVTLKGLGD